MPDIELTADQRDRLQAVQDALADEMVGKYGHVRPRDAVEFLLDRFDAADADVDVGTAAETGADAGVDAETGDDDAADGGAGGGDEDAAGDDATGGAEAGDDRLDAMMNLLEEHDDVWGEADAADERYAVELPDGSTSHARTKDDVRALLFKHYR